ncbi:MAG: non-heme iron oxygenase ferredoxin subunit [Acidobacteriota bacterium]
MAEFVKVAKTSDIEDQCARCVEIGGHPIALFNLGGEFYAIDDLCTHEDAPLSEGYVEGEEVECPWHAARFNIKSGKALCEPAYEDVSAYKVRVVGDDIEVEFGK